MEGMQVLASFTPLIGREQDIETALRLLIRPDVRLVTLSGVGGIGKTRLALKIAAESQQNFVEGCVIVPLAAIGTPDLVLPTIMQALGLQSSENHRLPASLYAFLRAKQLLLVLDNFEHVVSAAPALVELLHACPKLKILLTSRTILRVQGEHEFSVPPLALPNLQNDANGNAVLNTASVALFVQRAQAVQRDLLLSDATIRTIAEICASLDGLPLAIELAAARIKHLSPQELLNRLEHRLPVLTNGGVDLPVRQQTLRNMLDWSYGLLNDEERWLFRRLSIFSGGFTLEAGASICEAFGKGNMTLSVLDGISLLLNNSLLQRAALEDEEPRFLMLETVREYGLEYLGTHGELEETGRVHAAHYLAYVEEAEPALSGRDQNRWLERLERERYNIRAALKWLIQENQTEAVLRLAAALRQFWFFRGFMNEGRSFLEQVLTAHSKHERAPVSAQVMIKAWYTAGRLAYWQGDFAQAITFLEESVKLSRTVPGTGDLAASLNVLGVIKKNQGDFEVGNAMHEESLRLYKEIGHEAGIAEILAILGIEAHYRGEFVRVRELCEESLALSEESGDVWGMATNLHFLGWALYCQGEYTSAYRLSEKSVELFRTVGKPGFAVQALTILALEVAALGDATRAVTLLEEALALSKDLESTEEIACALYGSGYLSLRQGDIRSASTLFKKVLVALEGDWLAAKINKRVKWLLACCLEGLGEIAAAQDRAILTAQLFGAAEAMRTMFGYKIPLGIEQPHYNTVLAAARLQLGEEAFSRFWANGLTMTCEQALAVEVFPPDTGHGGDVFRPDAAGKFSSTDASTLTLRETEVLRLLAQGLTNRQIAERLVISPSTVNIHVQSIFGKLHINSRSAATHFVTENRLD